MRDARPQRFDEEPGTKYGPFTRYDLESAEDASDDTTATVKNFPTSFIPMKELGDALEHPQG